MSNRTESNLIIGKNIQRLLDEHQKTRRDVCKDLGFNYATFSDWLQGRSYPRQDKIEKLAAYFNVPRSALVDPPNQTNTNSVTIGRDNTAPIINGTATGNITINQNIPQGGEICQMYHFLPEEAKKRVDRIIKGEYEDAKAKMKKYGK